MRKVPVLSAVTLLAICSLAVAPVYAGTALANDPPSVSLAPGTNAAGAFNIDEFFAAPDGSATITGGSLDADRRATVDGSADPATLEYSIQQGDESGTAGVWVSTEKFGNRPDIDGNNRIVGQADVNWFVNWIPEGGSVDSDAPLGSAGGGGGTPGGGTPGGGALAASVGEVSLSSEGTWYKRSSGPAGDTGISASIDAEGNYSIAAAAGARAAIVTFSAGTADAVQVLAAPSVDVGAPIVGTHTVEPGGIAFLVGPEAISVGASAQLSMYYNASAVDGVAIAVIGFDVADPAAIAFETVSYSNPSGANLEAGVLKCLGSSIRSTSGSVVPAAQVFNGGTAAVTVEIARFVVAHANPITDYAINPNHVVASSTFDSDEGLINDILQAGAAPFSLDAGNLVLGGEGGFSNASLTTTLDQGEAVAECWAQRTGGSGGNVTLNVTDGGGLSFQGNTPGDAIPTDSSVKVQAVGTVQADGTAVFVTVQAAGISVNVSALSVRQIDQADNQFDANLL